MMTRRPSQLEIASRRPSEPNVRLDTTLTVKLFPWTTMTPTPKACEWVIRGSRGTCASASAMGHKYCRESTIIEADGDADFIDVYHRIEGREAQEPCSLAEFVRLNEGSNDSNTAIVYRRDSYDNGEAQDMGSYVILEQCGGTQVLRDPWNTRRLPTIKRLSYIGVRILRPINTTGRAWLKQYGVEAARKATRFQADGYIPRMTDAHNTTCLLREPFGRKGNIE